MDIQTHIQKFFRQAFTSGMETNPKELCLVFVPFVLLHSQ